MGADVGEFVDPVENLRREHEARYSIVKLVTWLQIHGRSVRAVSEGKGVEKGESKG